MKELATFDENVFNQMMRHKKFAESKGYDVILASVYGSQNYALETKESDVDSYLIVMPSLKDLALNRKPVSRELMYVDEMVFLMVNTLSSKIFAFSLKH